MLHQMPAGIIGNHGMRHAMRAQFPGGQRRALIARAGFIHPYMHWDTRIMRHINRRECGTPIHRRDPAGIAMGQDIHALPWLACSDVLQQRQAVAANGFTGCGIIITNRGGFGIGCRFARGGRQWAQHGKHFLKRPAQIDRGGAGFAKHRGHGFERFGMAPHRQRQAIGRNGTNQRRATHLHGTDGMRDLVFINQPQPFHLPGQLGLIEDTDGPAISLIKADAAIGDAVDLHERPLARFKIQRSPGETPSGRNLAQSAPSRPLSPGQAAPKPPPYPAPAGQAAKSCCLPG